MSKILAALAENGNNELMLYKERRIYDFTDPSSLNGQTDSKFLMFGAIGWHFRISPKRCAESGMRSTNTCAYNQSNASTRSATI